MSGSETTATSRGDSQDEAISPSQPGLFAFATGSSSSRCDIGIVSAGFGPAQATGLGSSRQWQANAVTTVDSQNVSRQRRRSRLADLAALPGKLPEKLGEGIERGIK